MVEGRTSARPPPVVLVTGCGPGGIGAAICKALLACNCTVYATDILASNLDDLRRVGCRCLELDVTDSQAVKAAVSQTMAEAGVIDILINCAGVMVQGSVLDTPPDASQKCLDVNVLGPVRVMQAVIPYMMQQCRGTIVNIGSVLGYTGMPFLSTYSASKAALQAVTDAARVELRPFNIRVVYVAPGWVATGLSKHALSSARAFLPAASPYSRFPGARRAAGQDLYTDPSSHSAGATPVGTFAAQLVPRLLQEPTWLSWAGWCKHIVCGHMGWFYWFVTCYLPTWLLDLVYGWHYGLLLATPASRQPAADRQHPSAAAPAAGRAEQQAADGLGVREAEPAAQAGNLAGVVQRAGPRALTAAAAGAAALLSGAGPGYR